MAAKVTGPTRRIPVEDGDGDIVGWVLFDGLTDYVNIEGSVYIPAEFYLRLPGDATQPSLLISYSVRNGAPGVSGVTLEAKSGGRHVQRADLDGLAGSLGTWSEMATKAVMRHGEATHNTLSLGGRAVDTIEATRAASAGRRRANQKITDAFLREVAALYQDNASTGRYAAIRERFDDCAESTAARYVSQARKAGYLPKVEKGGKK